MNSRIWAFVASALVTVVPTPGQNSSGAAGHPVKTNAWTMPRTPDGHPDLQGNWTNATLTALQRPPECAEKLVLTKAEADVYETQRLEATNKDRRDGPPVADLARGFNDFFYESGARLAAFEGVVRTSLIVDPHDGRLPLLTPEAQKRDAEARARARQHPADSAAGRSLDERCLLPGTTGPPMFPQTYNNNYQIVQTSDYVMILSEMIHDVRIIPLDGRPHVPREIHLWMGDARGHWEGDTLVVDSTNFKSFSSISIEFRNWPSSENLHVIERFTRTSADTILYRVTIHDPSTFTMAWTAEVPFLAIQGYIYEYSCHEGNYALEDILRAARIEEKQAGVTR